MKNYLKANKKFIVILVGLIALNWHYGFDARFTIINLLWIFINVAEL